MEHGFSRKRADRNRAAGFDGLFVVGADPLLALMKVRPGQR